MLSETKFSKLAEYDTPSVTNVVATYPEDPLCLGLYHPWSENWYTDQSIECMYPDLGPRVGLAVTAVYGNGDPTFDKLAFGDLIDALEEPRSPTILALEHRFAPDIRPTVGLTGGNMTKAMSAVGCVGCVSNGPGRDIDEIRPMEFQYLLTGVSPGHGDVQLRAVNVPVSIAGMDVAPGEIIHMDENGAVKFPVARLDDVLSNVEALVRREASLQSRLDDATSAQEVRDAFDQEEY